MFSSMSQSCYWYTVVSINALYLVAISVVLYSQYRYISQASVPSEVASFTSLVEWQNNSKYYLGVILYEIWVAFVNQVFFVSLVGFSLLAPVWEKFRAFCKPRLGDTTSSGIFYFMILGLLLAPQMATWDGSFNYPVSKVVSDISANALRSLAILVLMKVLRKRKLVTMSIISVSIICYGLFWNLYYPEHSLYSQEEFLTIPEYSSFFSLLRRIGFPADKVNYYTSLGRCYTLGWGRFAVFITDSGFNRLGLLEVLAAHRLAFWKFNFDFVKSAIDFLVEFAKIFTIFYIIDRPKFYKSFGFADSKTVPIGIALVLNELIFKKMQFLTAPLFNGIYWAMEYKADSFAASFGYVQALLQYVKNGAENSMATTIYGLFSSDHPALSDRISHLQKLL